jgi:uncharacterized protein (TIGR02246 family)
MDDVEEIKKLKARYFRGLDSKDWELYRDVFAEDVVVDLTTARGGVYQGREAFMAYIRSLPLVQSVHQGHMPEIELLSATTATGIWALEDYNLWEDGSQNHGYGHYLETYEKADGRWRIKTTRLSYLRLERTEPGAAGAPWVAGAANVGHLRGANPAKR